jgi:hypothetical protein
VNAFGAGELAERVCTHSGATGSRPRAKGAFTPLAQPAHALAPKARPPSPAKPVTITTTACSTHNEWLLLTKEGMRDKDRADRRVIEEALAALKSS